MEPRAAKQGQHCRYCEHLAVYSLVYGLKSDEYLPFCAEHEGEANKELKLMARGAKDKVEVGVYALPWSIESRMARATEPAPTYPEADENSNFGQRVSPRMAKSAVEAIPGVSPSASVVRVVSNEDTPETFMKALGTDWTNLRAFRTASDRITVTVDGQKYTVFSRRG